MKPFFPNLAFGWTFFAVLVALLVVASYTDLRRTVVPKWLTLTALALGAAFNLARGASMGSAGQPTWALGGDGPLVGALDGLLFAGCGFLAGFTFFFAMWLLGAAGGGDVKLFAALGAWVGPYLALWILVVSTVILVALATLKVAARLLAARPPATATGKSPARGLTYAFPLAVATVLVLLWFFRVDLHLAAPRAGAAGPTVGPAAANPPRV